MPHRSNFLLSKLTPNVLAKLVPHLSPIRLERGKVLAHSHERIHKVYFPHAGIISCAVQLQDGSAIETAMIGKDGAFGAGQALDDKLSLNHVVIQIAGVASVADSERICQLTGDLPPLRHLLIKYEQYLVSQVQQTAACNAVHTVEARTCKWLLRMHALVGPDLPLTQEFLAQMMGVTRPSVTGVAVEMQKAGMISYRRGHIRIEDLEQIKARVCECDEDVRSHYDRLFRPHELPCCA